MAEYPTFRIIHSLEQTAIRCGRKTITIRGATGEQPPRGVFPYIEFNDDGGGFCISTEREFNEFWDKLKELI